MTDWLDYLRSNMARDMLCEVIREKDIEIDKLNEQIAIMSEESDIPLWRRITMQRRELRVQLWWNDFWTKRMHEQYDELRELRKLKRDVQ